MVALNLGKAIKNGTLLREHFTKALQEIKNGKTLEGLGSQKAIQVKIIYVAPRETIELSVRSFSSTTLKYLL